MSDFFYGLFHTILSRPAESYIHQLSADTVCRLVDLPRAITDGDGWEERVKGIHVVSTS